ncbi:MAG TPA: hypothetical protein VFY20_09760 [Gemmatimonadales bacterium]|nr:hypothetical protein [Gemmatimonadales bacterium]
MARIIRFDSSQARTPSGHRRYPRFDEVQGEIENTAIVRLGAGTALGEACRLMQRLRDGSSPDARTLLDRLDDVLVTVRKQHEHAAYIVGLKAATFRLDYPVRELLDERRAELDAPQEE